MTRRTYQIEARVLQEGQRADEKEVLGAKAATVMARSLHRQGYWVEIFDLETRELLAGPYDPDLPLPSYIV